MNSQGVPETGGGNGQARAEDVLYAMSDEQILEMDGEVASDEWRVASEEEAKLLAETGGGDKGRGRDSSRADRDLRSAAAAGAASARNDNALNGAAGNAGAGKDAPGTDSVEPPEWLARMMEDAQAGGEARDFWEGILRARAEGAAYRAAIGTTEEAQALKELYPGGVSEARAAAERARQFEQIDRVYFGAAGTRPEESAAARVQLAQTLLREDPAAFREMVAAGVRALEEANGAAPLRLAAAAGVAAGSGAARAPATGTVTAAEDAQVAAYGAFERSANDELERSVGGAITRTLEQALPNLRGGDAQGSGGARSGVPLQERLGSMIRADVEAALKGDRQLGAQVEQILASRRFDETSRAQVVRLIGERARQLVPGSARRVLNEWTQTALAARRGRAAQGESVAGRMDGAGAAREKEAPRQRASENRSEQGGAMREAGRNEHSGGRASRIDYRKMSDEQILES